MAKPVRGGVVLPFLSGCHSESDGHPASPAGRDRDDLATRRVVARPRFLLRPWDARLAGEEFPSFAYVRMALRSGVWTDFHTPEPRSSARDERHSSGAVRPVRRVRCRPSYGRLV